MFSFVIETVTRCTSDFLSDILANQFEFINFVFQVQQKFVRVNFLQTLCEFVQGTQYTQLKIGTANVLTALSAHVTFKLIFTKYGKCYKPSVY